MTGMGKGGDRFGGLSLLGAESLRPPTLLEPIGRRSGILSGRVGCRRLDTGPPVDRSRRPARLPRQIERQPLSMGDRSKIEARRAANILRFEQAQRHGLWPAGHPVRCSCCSIERQDAAVMLELVGLLLCDSCIELAAEIVAERKGGT